MKNKEEEIKTFDHLASEWNRQIPEQTIACADHLLTSLNIQSGDSLLDVAAGTGILAWRLQASGVNVHKYVAVDISRNMLKELSGRFPDAETVCTDFEEEQQLHFKFDYLILFNSIPHFSDLDMLFRNASHHLAENGKFVIAHARTRQELKDHHKRIGYVGKSDPIPTDDALTELSRKYGFSHASIEDEQYFCYIGGK